jgi:hypothetical protein
LSKAGTLLVFALLVGALLAHAAGPGLPASGKAGGVLNLVQREELTTGFAIHETATIATVWPASPCFSTSSSSTRSSRLRLGSQLHRLLGWSLDAFARWPHVRSLVPHHGVYNWGRHTHVWLDK